MPSNPPQVSSVDQLALHFRKINERLATLERASSSGGGGGGVDVVEGTDPPLGLPPGSFFFDTDCEPSSVDFQAQINALDARIDLLEGINATRCRVEGSGTTIPTSAATTLTLGAVIHDPSGMFNNATDTITVPAGQGGLWTVGAAVRWASNATGIRSIAVAINGSQIFRENQVAFAGSGGTGMMQSVEGAVVLAAGDLIVAQAFQSTGGDLATSGASPNRDALWAYRIG